MTSRNTTRPTATSALRLTQDGTRVRCGHCPTHLGHISRVAEGRIMLRLRDGYTRPDLHGAHHYAPTRGAREGFLRASTRASNRDLEAKQQLKDMATTRSGHETQRPYRHQEKLVPLTRDVLLRGGETVQCISCGRWNHCAALFD